MTVESIAVRDGEWVEESLEARPTEGAGDKHGPRPTFIRMALVQNSESPQAEKGHGMSSEALTALAAAGGTALVGAIATDAWETARNEMVRLFRRGGDQRQAAIEAQLDGNVVLFERADDPEQIRRLLAQLWQLELTRLLEEYPDVESELRDSIARVQDILPIEHSQWVQNNFAGGGGVVYGVQDGTQTIHHHPVPTPLRRSAAGGEGLLERRDGV